MAGLDATVDRVFARPRQITDRFVVWIGDPHGAQLPGARALSQLHAVTPISLDSIAWAPRDLRWGNDLAGVAPGLQRTLQSESRRASLVHDVQLLRGTDLRQHLQQLVHVMRDLADQAPGRSTW